MPLPLWICPLCARAFPADPLVPSPFTVTRKIVIKMKCKDCSQVHQITLKRCKHFELGAKKKAE